MSRENKSEELVPGLKPGFQAVLLTALRKVMNSKGNNQVPFCPLLPPASGSNLICPSVLNDGTTPNSNSTVMTVAGGNHR